MAIIRIVKMHFREEEIEAFREVFAQRQERIRGFAGCQHLELWQDDKDKSIFFTYSTWENEEYLNHYRYSAFFRETWSLTRALFAAEPAAWTLNRVAG